MKTTMQDAAKTLLAEVQSNIDEEFAGETVPPGTLKMFAAFSTLVMTGAETMDRLSDHLDKGQGND